MKRHRLSRLSLAERVELNRQLKDAMEARLIRPNESEFGSPIVFCAKLMARWRPLSFPSHLAKC
jgi:hypothetical protein